MFLESCPFFSRVSNFLAYICSQYSVNGFLCFCGISYDFSSCISYFVYLDLCSFLLGEPDQRFVSIVYPVKEPAVYCVGFFFPLLSLFYLFPL